MLEERQSSTTGELRDPGGVLGTVGRCECGGLPGLDPPKQLPLALQADPGVSKLGQQPGSLARHLKQTIAPEHGLDCGHAVSSKR